MVCQTELTTSSVHDLVAREDTLFDGRQELLRLWETPGRVVVLGKSCNAREDVQIEVCEAEGIPVVRRCSGGGTVLLAPGCLNYTLLLDLRKRPELQHIAHSYVNILSCIVAAIALPRVVVAGSDLLLDHRKVSGNAQRRTRTWLLHHGTLLYDMDPLWVERYLHEPRRQPVHRRSRSHSDFLGNLALDRATLVARLKTLTIM